MAKSTAAQGQPQVAGDLGGIEGIGLDELLNEHFVLDFDGMYHSLMTSRPESSNRTFDDSFRAGVESAVNGILAYHPASNVVKPTSIATSLIEQMRKRSREELFPTYATEHEQQVSFDKSTDAQVQLIGDAIRGKHTGDSPLVGLLKENGVSLYAAATYDAAQPVSAEVQSLYKGTLKDALIRLSSALDFDASYKKFMADSKTVKSYGQDRTYVYGDTFKSGIRKVVENILSSGEEARKGLAGNKAFVDNAVDYILEDERLRARAEYVNKVISKGKNTAAAFDESMQKQRDMIKEGILGTYRGPSGIIRKVLDSYIELTQRHAPEPLATPQVAASPLEA